MRDLIQKQNYYLLAMKLDSFWKGVLVANEFPKAVNLERVKRNII